MTTVISKIRTTAKAIKPSAAAPEARAFANLLLV